jgi:hypothetical protein
VDGGGASQDDLSEVFRAAFEIFADDPLDAGVAIFAANDTCLIKAHVEIGLDQQIGRDALAEDEISLGLVGGDLHANKALEAGVRIVP